MVPLLALARLTVRPVRSPYAVLGLSPGASRAAIEAAYRALIKLHHPDCAGGDADQAAEINHAYASLRGAGEAAPVALDPPPQREAKAKGSKLAWLLVLAIVSVLAVTPLQLSKRGAWLWPWRSAAAAPVPGTMRQFRIDAADSALLPSLGGSPSADAVEAGVTEAVRLSRSADRGAAGKFSAACHADLRQSPSSALLDHCLAFDAAMGTLSRRSDAAFTPALVAKRALASVALLSENVAVRQARIAAVRRLVGNLVPEATP